MLGGLAHNTVVERYTIERELGSGAFGTVYAARDSRSGQAVALKLLSRLSPSTLSRFKHEFRAVQGLNHPHIVRLDALLEHESGWLIAMELVEGDDLLTYVKDSDNDPSFEEVRLREAFGQLAHALSGLHEHGILHRDLKPANVRVAADGRVVLLDFGLVTGIASDAQSTHHGAAGTVAYMAPEQAAGGALSPAADWYAFGVCLYQALTGTLPFQADTALAVMFAKQSKLPESPTERLGAPVPKDLEELCMQLLATKALDRPRAEAVHRVLSASTSDEATGSVTVVGLDESEVFEGREEELRQITAAHEKARSDGLRMLLVEAESGMGKSTLVAEWLRQLKLGAPGALILKSQCYENEHSAFKAFDAGMETLRRRLNKLTGKDGQLLLPPHACLLPKIFPALAGARALMRAPLHDVPADPTSALRCGLIAFAKLLERLGENDALVLVIDDLQWADPESFRLLRTVSEGAHAPHVLVLATVRPESELEAEIAAELKLLGTRMPIERLPLSGLSKGPCERLACNLLAGSVMAGWLDRITTESRGHPLFVSVLSRYATSRRPSTSSELSLEAALSQTVDALDPSARALVELLALSGTPCSLGLLSRALGVDAEQLQKRAAGLVSAKLLRRLPQQQLACFHDLLRGIVFGTLGAARKQELHQALANIASVEALGMGSLRFLLRDEPERVGPQLAAAMAGWPRKQFSVIHMTEVVVHHTTGLYHGGDAAWQYLEAERARHERAFLFKTAVGKGLLAVSRFQAAVTAYAAVGPGPLATQYLDAAHTAHRVLCRAKHPYARLYLPVAGAQFALFAGEREPALALIRGAAREYTRTGTGQANEAPLAYLEGLLVGGDAGREQRAQALALAAAQGWQNPRRFVAMGHPVIDWLEAKSR